MVAATHPEYARAVLARLTLLPVSSLAGAFLFILAQLAFQSLRLWAVIPRALGLGPRRAAGAFMLGEWLNIFTPARAGDALKVALIASGSRTDYSGVRSATGAVLADKVIDLASLVLLCAVGGLLGLLWTQAGAGLVTLATGASIVIAGFAWLRWKGGLFWKRPWAWLRDLASGFSTLRDPSRCLASLSFSLGGWIAEGGALWLLCAALGVVLVPSEVLLALVLLNVAISVPIAFANLGVYEVALAAGLSHAGVPLPTALAVAASHHGLELLAANVGAAALSLTSATNPLGERAGR